MPSPSPENGGPARNFPTDPAEFDSDPRISYSKLDDTFLLETEDGQEFVYDSVIKRWVHQVRPAPFLRAAVLSARAARGPGCLVSFKCWGRILTLLWFQVDEELLRQQQEAYKVAGVDDEEALHPRDRKKRKQQASGDDVSIAAVALYVSSEY
jgi:HIV Tat-specific factor 1